MPYFLFDILRNWFETHGLFPYVRIFGEVQFRVFAAAVLSFAIVLVAGKPVIKWLRAKKIGDAGLSDSSALAAHATSKASTPTMGGILIIGSILISTVLLADIASKYVILALIVMLWLAVLGGIDDWLKLTAASRQSGSRQGLYAWEKLVFQLGLGLLVGYFVYNFGEVEGQRNTLAHVLNLPFQRTYIPEDRVINPSLWYLPMGLFVLVAVLMVTGMSNAVNITDGMDGLAAGISTAVSLGLVIFALIAGRENYAQYLLVPHVPNADELAVMAGATAGACLGFLWFNCSPAQVFMGDTGSLALGGLLGFISIVIRQELLLLIMSAVFLIEIGSVTLQVGYFKLSKGKRIFRCAPYHHHLHLGGWTEQQVVARFWIISILLVLAAIALVKVR